MHGYESKTNKNIYVRGHSRPKDELLGCYASAFSSLICVILAIFWGRGGFGGIFEGFFERFFLRAFFDGFLRAFLTFLGLFGVLFDGFF